MTTLYKSTDPFVRALLRDVEGQVRSYAADHPEANLTDRSARSIAKRVTGQIVSSWARLSDMRANLEVRMSEGETGDRDCPSQVAEVRCASASAAMPMTERPDA